MNSWQTLFYLATFLRTNSQLPLFGLQSCVVPVVQPCRNNIFRIWPSQNSQQPIQSELSTSKIPPLFHLGDHLIEVTRTHIKEQGGMVHIKYLTTQMNITRSCLWFVVECHPGFMVWFMPYCSSLVIEEFAGLEYGAVSFDTTAICDVHLWTRWLEAFRRTLAV